MLSLASLSMLLALAGSTAAPQAKSQTQTIAFVHQAQAAEESGHPAEALTLYKKILVVDPDPDPLTKIADDRIHYLEPRSDDDFKPFHALERMKTLNALHLTPAEVTQFEQEVDHFPAGLVRQESRAFIADAWLRLLHDPVKAVAAHQKWLAEPGLDFVEQSIAKDGLKTAEGRVHAGNKPVLPPSSRPLPNAATDASGGHGPAIAATLSAVAIFSLGLALIIRRRRRAHASL